MFITVITELSVQ